MVYDDERMIRMSADRSCLLAFISCEFYQFSCRKLDAVHSHVSFQLGIGDQKFFKLLRGDDGILEKASCCPYLGPIRQFLFSDGDDDVRHFLSGDVERIQSLRSDDVLDIVVLDVRDVIGRLSLQCEDNGSDDDFIFQCMLEDAITIAKFAFSIRPYFFLSGRQLYAFHFVDDILGLLAICADITHRSCSHLPWYKD